MGNPIFRERSDSGKRTIDMLYPNVRRATPTVSYPMIYLDFVNSRYTSYSRSNHPLRRALQTQRLSQLEHVTSQRMHDVLEHESIIPDSFEDIPISSPTDQFPTLRAIEALEDIEEELDASMEEQEYQRWRARSSTDLERLIELRLESRRASAHNNHQNNIHDEFSQRYHHRETRYEILQNSRLDSRRSVSRFPQNSPLSSRFISARPGTAGTSRINNNFI